MKKKLLTLVTALLILMLSMVTAMAADTTAKYQDGKLTVSGTGTGAVQIVLFDPDGNPLYMTTAIPDADGSYAMTLPEIKGMKDGKYTVKTANNDGTAVKTTPVTVAAASGAAAKPAPATGDTGVILWIAVVAVCAGGTVAVLASGKKKDTGKRESR